MKYASNERGAVSVLVIVLALVVVAVVGLAVYNVSKARNNDTQSVNTSPSPEESTATTASPTTTPAHEFKVAELGFKMTLPSGLADLKYVAQTNLPGTAEHPSSYSTATFSTSSLERADSACSAGKGPLGAITRYSENPTFVTGLAAVKKVGDFYLGFQTPQSPCSNKSDAEQLETSQATLLRQAFDSASAL